MSASNRDSVSEVVTLNAVMRELKAIEEHVQKIDGLFTEQTKLSQNVSKVNDRLDSVCNEIGKMNTKIAHLEGVQNEQRRLFAKGSSDKNCAMTKHGEDVGFVDPSAKKGGKCNALRGLCTFIYNPRTKLVMGRNCKEWAQLMAFYTILYAVLVGFWAACLYGFLSTTTTDQPSLVGFQSMLQLNPAMGYRPQPDFETNLIKFNASLPNTYQKYLDDVNAYLEPYFNESVQGKLFNCDAPGAKANETAGCQFRPKLKAPGCFPEVQAPYGLNFASGKPCIMLKMNRIYGWMPNYVNGSYQDVKVRCNGENPADVENLGTINYMPGGRDENGTYGLIEAKYFPFMNKPYLSPLIFAQFNNIVPYTLSLIWCQFDDEPMTFRPDMKFWVSSLLNERAGGVHFELVVDKAPNPIVLAPVAAQTAAPAATTVRT